ncbi:SDR family NAD(P)-dependent oxidoreductase [Fibrobacter sp. UWB12]|uniref:SDR family NAD(P)-dependent oxidoreductase n=1 Tax=Fibrobacter sp. UWB12 TaxID=1896203 RepID=UPI0009243D9B|nr:SDR family oxidoreductase [Fibrobacter sp. UWB12]SHK26480.1 NAD(P)-dependent dehydrogenase, short-chain alcohol dehydrogenase family [Fibrobacter sp. UWB12]
MEPSFNPFSLQGKTILVTGASSGIGRAIAEACAKMGATIVLNGRNADRLKSVCNELPGENHTIIMADLTDYATVSAAVEGMPRLDGVVHCAGIGHRKIAKMLEADEIDRVMNVNFKAPVMLQTELLKQKKVNKAASIIFMSSMAADSGSIGNGVYSASKGALISYVNCLMLELAPRQIRVNAICPAMVWTDLILKDGLDENELKRDEQNYPLKRYGKPEDVANLAIYLLSDASSWMTGSSIRLTGGGR